MRYVLPFRSAGRLVLTAVAWTTLFSAAHALRDVGVEAPEQGSRSASQSLIQQAFEGAAPSAADGNTAQEPAVQSPAQPQASEPQNGPEGRAATIIQDLSTLPAPVKEMRERLVEAAASGDIERLRPIIEGTPKPPQIMNGAEDDPIETLKGFSGDPEGQEILAIMLDILSSGAALLDPGTPDETYVWPYFAGKPLASLTAPERVDLLRIVTAGDLLGMEENGNYNFYRIGITPDGQWKFMTGGD